MYHYRPRRHSTRTRPLVQTEKPPEEEAEEQPRRHAFEEEAPHQAQEVPPAFDAETMRLLLLLLLERGSQAAADAALLEREEEECVVESEPPGLLHEEEVDDDDEDGQPPSYPPGRPARRHKSTRLPLMLAALCVFLCAAVIAGVFLLPLVLASATVTIIPVSVPISTTLTVNVVTTTTTGSTVNQPGQRQHAQQEIAGRVLSSLTLSQERLVATTGTGFQPAQASHGTITFYNAQPSSQVVAAGTLLTGADGIAVVTDESALLPPAIYPTFGQVTVSAHAVQAGPLGNLKAGDIYGPCCRLNVSAVSHAFTGGEQARSFPVVRRADLSGAVASLTTSLRESAASAFEAQVHADETLLTPSCTPTVTADHAVGEEATHLSVTVDETCQAEAYSTRAMRDLVTQVTTKAAAAQGATAGYHLSGNIEVSVIQSGSDTAKGQKQGGSLSVLRVKGTGVWTYQFTDAQLQYLAQRIAGKSMREAKAILLATPGVQSVTLQLSGDNETTLPRDPGQIKMGQLIGLGL